MNEWWLIGLIFSISLVVCAVLVFPLRRSRILSASLVSGIMLFVVITYYYWGNFEQWQDYIHRQEAQQLAKNMLKTIKSPQELINKLKNKLDDSPSSAKGWFLLGRLYSSQNELKLSADAFAKAHQLDSSNEQYTVHYAHSLWQMNDQKFNSTILDIFNQLLITNPKQPDALAMLAMSAFINQDYENAINYWQRLLKLAPEQSEEAMAIRKAIAKAQEKLNTRRAYND
ncbi:tetratricopeptide repeat protein [Legionella waltersii]|uniref:Cytochrome c type biogenesis protein CcmH n=1 Tax=Legionella waltersii TaxID=66969 RepID=A0A0W1AND3_9GAMM|nr:tetratricopeptide repeat protein [Legionella waltersii]KTD82849.1 cytochrome c type biogenesis protein CcmH [Legionella waltersii]SNV01771.1 cytochrome c type biogenesis protein CcmH [Legionella waltersii]